MIEKIYDNSKSNLETGIALVLESLAQEIAKYDLMDRAVDKIYAANENIDRVIGTSSVEKAIASHKEILEGLDVENINIEKKSWLRYEYSFDKYGEHFSGRVETTPQIIEYIEE